MAADIPSRVAIASASSCGLAVARTVVNPCRLKSMICTRTSATVSLQPKTFYCASPEAKITWTKAQLRGIDLSKVTSFDVSVFDVSVFDMSAFDVSVFDVFDMSVFDVSAFDVYVCV